MSFGSDTYTSNVQLHTYYILHSIKYTIEQYTNDISSLIFAKLKYCDATSKGITVSQDSWVHRKQALQHTTYHVHYKNNQRGRLCVCHSLF